MRIPIRSIVVVLALLGAAGCAGTRAPQAASTAPAAAPARQRYHYVQLLMGVQVRLVLYTTSEQAAKTAAKAAFDRVAQLEALMSDYQRDSELMKLCDRAGSGPKKVSPELFEVLSHASDVSEASDGAFDVTVGPFVQLWRQARKTRTAPDSLASASARRRVGWKLVRLDRDARTVDLTVPGMRLDLGGIAKGYAGDEATRILREHGVASALFEAGGDIVVSDAPPDSPEGWTIETPDGRKLTLANAAVSTSGHTEQFVEIDGMRYSHVVDPRTGVGLTTQYLATVVASRGVTSDALSTAATVLGPAASQPLVKRFGARAWVDISRVETTSRQRSTTSETNP